MLMQSSLFFTSVAVLTGGLLVSITAYPVKGLSATPLLEFRRQKQKYRSSVAG